MKNVNVQDIISNCQLRLTTELCVASTADCWRVGKDGVKSAIASYREAFAVLASSLVSLVSLCVSFDLSFNSYARFYKSCLSAPEDGKTNQFLSLNCRKLRA